MSEKAHTYDESRSHVLSRSHVFEVLGEALLQAQEFERHIGKVIGLVFSDRTKVDLDDLAEIHNDARSITLGRFLKHLERRDERAGRSAGAHEKLATTLEARNRMVHRLFDDPDFNLDDVAGRQRLLAFLIDLQFRMVELDVLFTYYEAAFLEDVGVLPPSFRRENCAFFELCDVNGAVLMRVESNGKVTEL